MFRECTESAKLEIAILWNDWYAQGWARRSKHRGKREEGWIEIVNEFSVGGQRTLVVGAFYIRVCATTVKSLVPDVLFKKLREQQENVLGIQEGSDDGEFVKARKHEQKIKRTKVASLLFGYVAMYV